MEKDEVITAIKIFALFVFYVVTIRKFTFSKKAAAFDVIVALGSSMLLIGTKKPEYMLLSKYIILAAFMFYLLRGLMERLPAKLATAIFSLVQILYLSIPFLNLAYYFQSGQGIGLDAMFAIAQTNIHETLEFLQARSMAIIGLIGIYLLTFVLLYKTNLYLKAGFSYNLTKRVRRVFAVLLVVIIWHGATRVVGQSHIYKTYEESQTFLHATENHHVSKDLVASNKDGQLKNIVIVIGESANRDYMSAYGFRAETTPWLASMLHDKKIIKFNHAYSCDKFTTKVLAMALAEPNQYNKLSRENNVDLIDVFHKAGYKVWWISNQGRNNNLHESAAFYASRADKAIFVNTNGSVYDEKLLDYLPKQLSAKGNIIFIHLMGSHGGYGDRFPKKYKKEFFPNIPQNVNDVNAYCDSILYTDYILERIFDKGNKELSMDALLYFSDHGEKPGVPRDRFEFAMARIPLVIYLSPQYSSNHKDISLALQNNVDKYFTNDLLYDTILGVADIVTNHISQQYDLASPQYAMTKEQARTQYGTVKITDEKQNQKP